ncbi:MULTISPECIES: hypothetical protein [Oceanithermus]|uniref:Elongation factor G-binding protein C-terminal treble-clef zinc-finger domain-containing protein n=2 Tax=Oceanithermus desulfurans TaxID=227924 RepID=A0A511RIB6_9DEIN|nr:MULTISPECIES: hypothetical protein [Oceanithermus]MBB6030311.1 hypothetical protein [Oceanithermus desulfurans]GEM89388.1 hypothetical protein ODE01S_08220 [Oceanithermus desulfurans NBRC 100063]HHH27989.1 hypothetical protein [Polyangiaceae bacterium]
MAEDCDERSIIARYFPGTPPELWPAGEVLYYRDEEGRIVIREHPLELRFEVLERVPSGKPVLCDACRRQIARHAAVFARAELPAGEGRHYLYRSFCADTQACAERAEPRYLREILARVILH